MDEHERYRAGVAAERAYVVAWLRKYTHLVGLAKFLEDGWHVTSEPSVRDRARKQGLSLRGRK